MTKAEAMAAALNEFLDVSWEVEAAAVVSPDGLPMASALPPDVEEDRLAAMSASLLTLGERAAHNLNRGELAQVLVEGERGYVLLMAAGPDAVLVAVTSHDAKVGLVLFEMRKAVESIAAVMDGSFRQLEVAALEPDGDTGPVVDGAAVAGFDAPPAVPTEAPPAPPEKGWDASSIEWQSGAPEEQPDADEAAEALDGVSEEHPRGSEYSVPEGAAADPAAWDPHTSAEPHRAEPQSSDPAAQEGTEGDYAEHGADAPADGDKTAPAWHNWRSQTVARESDEQTGEESEPEPSWS